MKRLLLIFLFTFAAYAQKGQDVEQNFTEILNTKNSKEIVKSTGFKYIQKHYGGKALVHLAKFFDLPTKTNVFSDCQNRFLTKGEVAIIVADRIEMMPYFNLTGIQNCILSHCENNSNLIEYYFPQITSYSEFQKKYYQYLQSK